MRKTRLLLLLCCVGLLWGAVLADTSAERKRRKARYLYMQGVVIDTQGKTDAAMEYFKRAYETDPTYAEAASAYGAARLLTQSDSLVTLNGMRRSLELMRPYVDKYAGDMFESQYYAYVAGQLDSVSETLRVYKRMIGLFPERTENLLRLADAYMLADSLDKALEVFDRYESLEGKSAQLSLRKISYMLSKKDSVGALNEATMLVADNPRDGAYRILKGNVYDVIGEPDSALAYYKQAEKVSPQSGSAKMALAKYYREHGDSASYDNKIYEALLAEDFGLEEKKALLGDYLQALLIGKNDTTRGDHLFEVLRSQYPHEASVLDLSARYNAAKGNMGAAIEQISYAIDQAPDNEDYWGQLMTYQLSADKYKDIEKTYHRALEHIKPNSSMKLMRASGLQLDSNYTAALQVFDSLIMNEPGGYRLTDSVNRDRIPSTISYEELARLSTLFTMAGDTYYQQKKVDDAFRAYDNALIFLPTNNLALNNYAYFLLENGGDADKALEMSKQAMDADPENPTYLDTYAWALFKKGDYAEALKYQKDAMEKTERSEEKISTELYSHLGDILFMNGDPQGALENWEKALKLDPGNELLKRKVQHKTFFYE